MAGERKLKTIIDYFTDWNIFEKKKSSKKEELEMSMCSYCSRKKKVKVKGKYAIR